MNDPNWWVVAGLLFVLAGVVLVGNCDYGEGPFQGTGPEQANWYGVLGERGVKAGYKTGWYAIPAGFLLQLIGQFLG